MGDDIKEAPTKWYHGITKYQWLILAIACAGWIFDVYEGRFSISPGVTCSMICSLALRMRWPKRRRLINGVTGFWLLFLLGGTAGGLLFGSLADRYGRRPIMIATILTYSVFAGLTYFATELWQVATLRFLWRWGLVENGLWQQPWWPRCSQNMLEHMLPGFSMLQVW